LIALPTADHIEDTRPSGFSNDQLYVLKTYPIFGLYQSYIPMMDRIRNAILIQNLNSAHMHIRMMENLVKDGYYHILVTGDTNSGKSIFINGLLRRKILPTEGSSLTSAFVEVLDARDIGGKEEVHLCKKGMNYGFKHEHTFVRENIDNLHDIMYDWYSKRYNTMYDAIKVYVDHSQVNANLLFNRECKIHIIDSFSLNTSVDKMHSLFKKQQNVDVLIFVIDARHGLTESSRNIVKNYCRETAPIFIIITHLDCVCCCGDICRKSCREVCKQRIMDTIKEISSVTFASADKLVHCVNPTLIWDNNSGNVVEQIPSEWKYMEKCLHIFIYDQFHFHKLSPIKNYLQMLMHDVILFSLLNETIVAANIKEMTREILQLGDNISQLEDRHDKAYIEAKKKINEIISDIRGYILEKINDLKEHPEKLISREMLSRIGLVTMEADLHRLLQERRKEIEEECNQKVDEYIQSYKNYIDQLVKELPESSRHEGFSTIKSMLQSLNFVIFGIRKQESSLTYKVLSVEKQVLLDLMKDSTQTQSDTAHRISRDKVSKNSKNLDPTMRSGEGIGVPPDKRQESR
jgi:GTP-binding protein EngB required for normal cell division/glycine cleavage system H lipoate-binding protein